MNLREYLRIGRRWWWLVTLGCVLAGSAAFLLTTQMTPVYRARAVLLVNQVQNPSSVTYQDILGSQQLTKTYSELVTTSVNLERSVQKLGRPEFTATVLQGKVNASAVSATQLIEITAEDADPATAALIADTVANTFPQYIEEAQLAGKTEPAARPLNTVFVAEKASIPTSPVRPNKPLNVALGIALGLIVMVAAVAVVEYLDDDIDQREDVEALGLPFLGNVLQAERPKGADKRVWVPSVIEGDPLSPLAESYRQIQASLAFALTATEAKVLLVTSTFSGEGKSTTAANLSEALAESSKRVLLIDGDLRKPDAHRYFSLPNNSGLSSTFLADIESINGFLKKVTDQMYVLTSGPVPPNPSELLSSKKMAEIINALRESFDLIVIDSPPLIGLADASLWANLADGILLIARQGRTRRAAFSEAVAVARATHKPIIGTIVNGIGRKDMANAYYKYGYDYKSRDKARS
jgi:capsular exopolysaccharide synthesis family protein